MSDKAEEQTLGKPDGSAYEAHLAGIAERNLASKKAARERRQAHERTQAEARRAAEKLQDAGMRREGGGQQSPKLRGGVTAPDRRAGPGRGSLASIAWAGDGTFAG